MKGCYYLAICLILILPLGGCVTSPDINEKQTAVVTGAKTIKQADEKSKDIQYNTDTLVKALQETGFIGRINIESNEVWVDESLWYSTNVGEKENIIRLISQYFNEKRGYERVTVYGWHTGKTLATMTLFGGIKFY